MKIFFSIIFCLISTLSFAADQSIGQMVWVKGVIKAMQPNQSERVLTRRSPIYAADKLTTNSTSTGEIAFTDNSFLSLRTNTILEISQYKFGKNISPNSETYVANLTKGGFRTITGLISKDHAQGYKSNTPVATIAVLGTEYSVYYTPGKGKAGMDVQLEKGSVMVQNPAGKVILKKCMQEELKNHSCTDKVFSHIGALNQAPQIVSKQPAVFKSDVPVIASISAGTPPSTPGSPGGPAGGANPSSGPSAPNGGTKGGGGTTSGVISSFCIGG